MGSPFDNNPPVMGDVVCYQGGWIGNGLHVAWKINHGKNWKVDVTSPGQSPFYYNQFPTVNHVGAVYTNVLYQDGRVEGKVPDSRPWRIGSAIPTSTSGVPATANGDLWWFE
jgi:hypothetical protein